MPFWGLNDLLEDRELRRQIREMKRQGIDVISLSIGEPDFDTQEHIKQAAIEAINKGFKAGGNLRGI